MLKTEELPQMLVLDAILQNRGLKEDDSNREELLEQIKHLSPAQAFSQMCNWYGFIDWGPQFIRALDALRAAHYDNPERPFQVTVKKEAEVIFPLSDGHIRVSVKDDQIYINGDQGSIRVTPESSNAAFVGLKRFGSSKRRYKNDADD